MRKRYRLFYYIIGVVIAIAAYMVVLYFIGHPLRENV